jgi:hypothetical protein
MKAPTSLCIFFYYYSLRFITAAKYQASVSSSPPNFPTLEDITHAQRREMQEKVLEKEGGAAIRRKNENGNGRN